MATPSIETWVFSSPQWLSKVLPDKLRRARILAFDYSVSLNENDLSCQDFLVQGDILLNALLNLRSTTHSDTQPLFAVCHSLGGLILKQALCIANEQPYRYGSILSSVAGVIFLGTPHKGITEGDTLTKWSTILASTANFKRPINLPEQRVTLEAAMLNQLAVRFEDVSIQAPILSVAENKKTKVYGGFMKSKNLVVSSNAPCHSNILTYL